MDPRRYKMTETLSILAAAALLVAVMFIGQVFQNVATAHSGRTDAKDCHTEKATGKYHCHEECVNVDG